MSNLNVPSSEEFREHFEKNYQSKVKSYIKWAKRQISSGRLTIVIVVAFVASYLPLSETSTFLRQYGAVFLVMAFAVWLLFFGLTLVYMDSLKVKEKDILAYFLLQAADRYHAFLNEKQQEFLDECIVEVSRFGRRLGRLLSNMQMPLKLPSVSQLEDFENNITERIIPALRQHKDYPAAPQGRDYSEMFVSLARLFFYESGYEELPTINKAIADNLREVHAEPEEQRGGRIRHALGSSKALFPLSFLGVTAVVLFSVYVFRGINNEALTYWSYVSEKAVEIVGIIVGGWLAVLLAVVLNRGKTKS